MDRRTQVEKTFPHLPEYKVKIGWESHDYCANNLNSIRLTEHLSWLKRIYMRVSHREMSLQPLETTAKIYQFVEEPLSDDVKDVIKRMVNPSQKDIDENKQSNGLETFKNSSEIVNKWMSFTELVRYNDLPIIESQCRGVIEHIRAESFRDGISAGQLRRMEIAFDP